GVRAGVRAVENPLGEPEISVGWPRKGDYCGGTAFVRGCVRGRTSLSGLTADSILKEVDADGLYSFVAPKSVSSNIQNGTWLVKLDALKQSTIAGERNVRLTDDLLTKTDDSNGGSDNGSSGSDGNSSVSNPTGSSFTVTPSAARSISYNNVVMNIPAGAVSEETVITIVPLSESDVKNLNVGMMNITSPNAGYRFLFNGKPHGQFKKPIQITIGYNPSLLLPGQTENDVNMYYYDEGSSGWRKVDKVESATSPSSGQSALKSSKAPTAIQTSGHQVCASTDHFTDYINATIAMPDHPETNAFNPNTMKDIKAADPSANINMMEPPSGNSSGDASVHYPIEIPKGTNGVQPSVSLTYNSSTNASWCGYGWDIDVSSVSIDTKWGVPKYSDSPIPDTYVMDGQTLVPDFTKGSSTERYYQPRVEGAFSKIVRSGDISNCSWIVTTRNGTKYYYGSTSSSRLQSAGKIAQWKLDRMEDINGNCITYKYQTNTSADVISLYLSRINYTGMNGSDGKYSIEFTSSVRDDKRSNFRFGFKTVTDRKLSTITVRYNSAQIRKYELIYGQGAYGHQILKELRQYNGADKKFYSHTFDYYDSDSSIEGQFESPVSWGNGEIGKSKVTSKDANASLTISPFTCMKYLSVGVGAGVNTSDTETKEMMLDIDGDGLPDLVRKSGSSIVYCKNLSHTPVNSYPGVNGFGSPTEIS
ncbi:MAG TPA: SpvB/TcaC N-terminal domain-containing protein, partial [Spirochaetota bacterium]